MCGRFTSTSPIHVLAETFEVDEVRTDPAPPCFNVAPTQQVLAVACRHGGKPANDLIRALGRFRWGLVPSWAKDLSVGAKMINARAESVASKPAYRTALVRRRCLIPADAFYEWQVRPGQTAKQPYAIRLATGAPMAFAGLWEAWWSRSDPDAEPVRSCVIITTTANEALEAIHHRMPVVLGPETWDRWLDPGFDDPWGLGSLMVPAPAEWFTTVAVSDAVNRVANDGPGLLEPV